MWAEHGPPPGALDLRVALLGGATLDLLGSALRLALLQREIAPELKLPAYGAWHQELLDPESEMSCFAPRVAVLVLTAADLPEWPAAAASVEEADALADRVLDWILEPCERFHARCGSEFIVTTLPVTGDEPHGSLGARLPHDRNNFVRRVNLRLGDRAPDFVHLFDAAQLASHMGGGSFFDARLWFEAKLPISLAATGPFAAGLAAVISGVLGRARKCLVLDLDDTLWGGVIGDVGLEGIELGEGGARGEAFKAFQSHLKQLREHGVLLAVCSKNEERNARLPFEKHPETVLGLEDFVAFRANWLPKSENIRSIAEELDLAPSAFVFADDNPAEREQVRQALPEVGIAELPEDPAGYSRALDEGHWFERVRITEEDRHRHEHYRSRGEARRLEERSTDLSDFLASLEMRAELGAIGPGSLSRATQLINKTNQFNLTTRRLTQSEVEEIVAGSDNETLVVRLADRFGDHGLIAVLTAHVERQALVIDDWLMSCRVLKRGVERLMLNELGARAVRRGLTQLRGRYVPTGRNELVRTHYHELGFEAAASDGSATDYQLELADFSPLDHFVRVSVEGR